MCQLLYNGSNWGIVGCDRHVTAQASGQADATCQLGDGLGDCSAGQSPALCGSLHRGEWWPARGGRGGQCRAPAYGLLEVRHESSTDAALKGSLGGADLRVLDRQSVLSGSGSDGGIFDSCCADMVTIIRDRSNLAGSLGQRSTMVYRQTGSSMCQLSRSGRDAAGLI